MEDGFKTNIITFLHESGHWFDYNALDIPIRDKLPKLKDLKEVLLLKKNIFRYFKRNWENFFDKFKYI